MKHQQDIFQVLLVEDRQIVGLFFIRKEIADGIEGFSSLADFCCYEEWMFFRILVLLSSEGLHFYSRRNIMSIRNAATDGFCSS